MAEDEPHDEDAAVRGHGPGFDRPEELPPGDFHSFADDDVEEDR